MSAYLGERDGKRGLSHWNIGDQPVRRRHEPTDSCHGRPMLDLMSSLDIVVGVGIPTEDAVRRWTCKECRATLCACEMYYGHDCEVSE